MDVSVHSRASPGPPEFTGAQFWEFVGHCQAREGSRLTPHLRRCRCQFKFRIAHRAGPDGENRRAAEAAPAGQFRSWVMR